MFVVLDTNHFRELGMDSPAGRRLAQRMNAANPEVCTCIVVAEETLRGWLGFVKRCGKGGEEVSAYASLQRSIEALAQLVVLPFDDDASAAAVRLRKAYPRSGTMDLKIAAICLSHDAVLLTRNVRDFDFIPDLQVENWLD